MLGPPDVRLEYSLRIQSGRRTMNRSYPVSAHTHYIQIPGAPSYPLDALDERT